MFLISPAMDAWKFDMHTAEQLPILHLKTLHCVSFNLPYLFIPLDLPFYVNSKVQFLFDSLTILKFMLNEIKSIVCIYIYIYIKRKKNIWRRWRAHEFNSPWNYQSQQVCVPFASDSRACCNLYAFLLFYHHGISGGISKCKKGIEIFTNSFG